MPYAQENFRAEAAGPEPQPGVMVGFGPPDMPLEKFADFVARMFSGFGKDVTVVSDKPSRLRDGTPAREHELHMLLGVQPFVTMGLIAKRGDQLVNVSVWPSAGKITDDLKAILYSLQFQPGRDEPVDVPTDVRQFLDEYCRAYVSHDLAKVMNYWSDKYLDWGVKKGGMEGRIRPLLNLATSFEIVITEFIPAGDMAYLTGFTDIKPFGRGPLRETSIIKENGQWKWYGNQRDAPASN